MLASLLVKIWTGYVISQMKTMRTVEQVSHFELKNGICI